MKYREIAILGLGLIGGSLALSLKKSGYNGVIKGYDASPETMRMALEVGAIDTAATSFGEAVTDADMVVIAVPISGYEDTFKAIGPYLKIGAVVTDVGSVKGYVLEVAKKLLPQETYFIGGHPMAGSEKNGIMAASSALYEDAYYFLTPGENITEEIIEQVVEIVGRIGAKAVIVSPEEHDKIVARISHLPQLAASMLVNMQDKEGGSEALAFAAGGFKDTTRIASSNPDLWVDILLANGKEVIGTIKVYEKLFEDMRIMLENKDTEGIRQQLESAKNIRDSILKGH